MTNRRYSLTVLTACLLMIPIIYLSFMGVMSEVGREIKSTARSDASDVRSVVLTTIPQTFNPQYTINGKQLQGER